MYKIQFSMLMVGGGGGGGGGGGLQGEQHFQATRCVVPDLLCHAFSFFFSAMPNRSCFIKMLCLLVNDRRLYGRERHYTTTRPDRRHCCLNQALCNRDQKGEHRNGEKIAEKERKEKKRKPQSIVIHASMPFTLRQMAQVPPPCNKKTGEKIFGRIHAAPLHLPQDP